MFDLAIFNKVRVFPHCSCLYKLSKNSGKYHRDISEQKHQKRQNDSVVFKGTGCIKKLLDRVLSFKREAKKVNNKVVENNLYLIAQNGSGFDSYVVIINLPQWRTVINSIKNGAGVVSLKIFNGYVDQNKNPSKRPFQMRESSFY